MISTDGPDMPVTVARREVAGIVGGAREDVRVVPDAEKVCSMAGNVRPVADERDGLLSFLAQQRYVLRLTAHGLTEDQVRAAPTVSTLSVGGLIKHVAHTEYGWSSTLLQQPMGSPETYADTFRLADDETLADVLAHYDEVAARTDTIVGTFDDLGAPVPIPKGVPWFPDEGAWSVRWVLLHLIQETARHAGHADLVREHVDGGTAYPLMAAAEGWPESPWMKPWQPAEQPV
jgi:uncharacterized damage-inducible protein DinB